jgi:hypothetical protein
MHLQTTDTVSPLSLSAYADTMKAAWSTLTQTRTISENATLLRYLSHTDTTISVAPDIFYSDIVGLRFNQIPPSEPPFLALSAIAFVSTADGHLFFQPRDSGDWPASLELPGGFIRAAHLSQTTTDFINARVARDISILESEIQSTHSVTTFPFPTILEFMVVYHLRLTISKQELLKRRPELAFVPVDFSVTDPVPGSTLPLHAPSATIWEIFRNQL